MFNYLKKELYQVQGYEEVYLSMPVKELYDTRQAVNPAVYDFAQLYMDLPEQKQRFGCKCSQLGIEGPSILIFDGSTFAYSKAYDTPDDDRQPMRQLQQCPSYRHRSITYGLGKENVATMRNLLQQLPGGHVGKPVSMHKWRELLKGLCNEALGLAQIVDAI